MRLLQSIVTARLNGRRLLFWGANVTQNRRILAAGETLTAIVRHRTNPVVTNWLVRLDLFSLECESDGTNPKAEDVR